MSGLKQPVVLQPGDWVYLESGFTAPFPLHPEHEANAAAADAVRISLAAQFNRMGVWVLGTHMDNRVQGLSVVAVFRGTGVVPTEGGS